MVKMLVVLLMLGATYTCNAQEDYVIIGRVLQDGTTVVETARGVIMNAILQVYPIPTERLSQDSFWYRESISGGPKRYLVCEVDTFIIAFECRQVGDNIIMHSDDVTHIGTFDRCYNRVFLFADDGAIVGCACEDKLYDGPPRTCNLSTETSQTKIVTAIEGMRRILE